MENKHVSSEFRSQPHTEASAPRDEFVRSDNPRVREFLKASGVKIAAGG